MTDLTIFREYEPHECGDDGYPYVWHRGMPHFAPLGVKHIVRSEAGDRCQRCGHPFIVGVSSVYEEGNALHPRRTLRDADVPQPIADLAFEGLIADSTIMVDPSEARRTNWSPCDERCTHQGPFRFRYNTGEWTLVPEPPRGELTLGPDGYLHLMNGATVEAAWRILTVHHLNGRKHDLRWWNLAALCQRCHLLIQRKVIMERLYPFEHTEWFKVHAAGWYAYVYEGRNITRAEAEARQAELLGLERMV